MSAPEYAVSEIRTLQGGVIRTVRTCLHGRPVPVESVVTGEVVARLCPDCDAQLDA